LFSCFSLLSLAHRHHVTDQEDLPAMASPLDHLAQLLNATLDAQHHRKG
jgi:hypothetical protein